MRNMTKSLSSRLIFLFLAVLIVSSLSLGLISYYLNRNTSIIQNSDRALGIARTVAASVDADAFSQMVESREKSAYWSEFKSYLDEVITKNNLVFLYALYGHDEENVYYFAEGIREGDDTYYIDFMETETIDNYDENIASVFAGQEIVSDEIYPTDEWGYMVSGMAPIFNDQGQVIGAIGADVSVDEVLSSVNQYGLLVLIWVVALSIVLGIVIALYLKRSLGNPIAELTKVSRKIARGETDVEIRTRSNTEIGLLANSFRDMIATIDEQTKTLKTIAEGDLTATVVPRSDADVSSQAFEETIDRLNAMVKQINGFTDQLTIGSEQIASSAQSLATGATSQASAVEQLSSSVTEIAIQTRQNADLADKAAELANSMQRDTTLSFRQIEGLITAVNEIHQASNSIRYVLKVIEDIAFQTNILSLSASVEAARVGEHGKGFAAVSREIQNLSRKTSESAKETAALVTDTLQKTKTGVSLAEDVRQAMEKVVTNVVQSDRIASEIALSSKEQMIAIDQINEGINQVARVVHQNSSVAEKNAQVSQEMNRQTGRLSAFLSKFRVRS